MKLLTVSVFRNSEFNCDCTNGGISSKYTKLYIPHPNGPISSESVDPRQILVLGEAFVKPNCNKRGMFGGNFVYSCDSRFRAISRFPIPIHDRFENSSEYAGD